MKTQEYEKLLEPYLAASFVSADWPTGFTPRLLLSVKLHEKAIAQLYQDHGITDPRRRNPDIVKLMDRLIPDIHRSNMDRPA